ncbi:aminotransferase class I/II-fold pyridoxal phosphate-dependent enzyme [Defluviimonas sp. WL0002]|uniref:Aminotransferase class I/II-fold pyridoxal phosphate-dependent enzyme n=2 Tax=Albidovulum marisflavi TaxID=2984159 RepID=A0ABT2ZBF8_9RHOB|nr:aminotransferase class I/II-fold pyridoxal phosphate-dependent enzyme [Defluviimonas sp. WL0002]
MAPYALADQGPAGAISLAQNESAFGPSPMAIAAGQAALAQSGLYPDPEWTGLRAAISEVHGLDAQQILCGAGSMELIGCLIRAFAGPGDEVLGSQYGYLFTKTACQQAGASFVAAPEAGFTLSTDALRDRVTPRTRIVFLCNPGNPTGTRIPNAQIEALRDDLPGDVLLIVDQAYGEFDDQDPASIFALTGRGGTVVLRTLSKAYGLAGARTGWGLFPEAIGASVRKLLNPNNVSAVSQAMAEAAMRDQGHMRATVAGTVEIRARFALQLKAAGYDLPHSHANFVLIPFANADAAQAADTRLRDAGLLMRGMGGYGLSHCLRATIAAPKHMARAAEILATFKEHGHDR